MKRGRGEDKVMGPLFPRLHVNDADSGGLRAPPRNKMALYELFSIPSQRSSSDAGGALPRQPHQAGGSVPSAFPGQSCRIERSVSSPFCAPHTPAHMQEKVHPHSVGGVNQNTKSTCQERKSSLHHGFHWMATSAVNEQMGVNCSLLYLDDLSIVKGPFEKKSGEEEDFRFPTCVQPGNALHSNKDHRSIRRERTTHFHLHSPQKSGATAHSSRSQVQSSHGMHLRRDGSYSLMPPQCENNDEGKAKKTVGLQKDMEDSLSPSMRERAVDPLKIHRTSSNEEHPTFIQNELSTLQGGSVRWSQEFHGSFREARCLSDAEFKKKQVISNERTESCSKISLDKSLLEPSVNECDKIAGEMVGGAECDRTGSPDDVGNIDPLGNSNKNQALEDASRNDDASETSMVDSISGVDMHPDDVVSLIGPKHFRKARRAIVNQQRVFAVQMFELHRLIKVQKLIAGSSNLLLDDPSYFHSSPKSPVKDPSPSFLPRGHLQIKQKDGSHKVNESECATENTVSANLPVNPQVKIVKQKDGSNKAIHGGECTAENTGGSLPLPGQHDKGPICQLPRDGTRRVPSFPATSDNISGAWCFHPPGNQWLIPVMSPSEGLIYRPYTGPYPPSAAFMAPGCDPPSLPPGAGDHMKPAFGVPVHHQQPTMGVLPGAPAVAPNFFPAQYGVQVVKPHISSSPIEQMRSTTGPQPSGQPEQHSWSSCNMSNLRREGTFENAQKVHISEENDIQASTANCKGDRSHREKDVQPQFPGRPPQVHSRDQQAHVIKVVPHNPKCATESAARIFRSIQKERQQHDSV